MEESDRRRSRVEAEPSRSRTPSERAYIYAHASLLSHAARATIMPARFMCMRTFAIASLGHGGMGIPFSAIADGDQCINR